jgi:cytoplasmic iron level regulating protein YaaA (DUF328/UPF0246 family)
MKIILSPAKSLDFENAPNRKDVNTPLFIEESQYLTDKLKKLSSKQIQKLMNVSPEIADLNFQRFYNWKFPFDQNAKPSVFVFTGEAYRGLDVTSFTDQELTYCNDKLRILSGLYGLLKPMDLILPYRLEMGTSFKVTPKVTNLYKFWGNKITDALNEELQDDEILVNLASNEYNKVVNFNDIKSPVITCSFKEEKNGEYKAVMTFAKRARGTMARYIIKNNIENKEDLKGFDMDNYVFNQKLSTDSEFVFTR